MEVAPDVHVGWNDDRMRCIFFHCMVILVRVLSMMTS